MVEFDMPGHAASWCAGYPEICPSPTCKQPLNRTSTAYLDCYKNALLGDAAFNLSAMRHEDIYGPWERGFGPGGCPVVQPAKCEGAQCGDRMAA